MNNFLTLMKREWLQHRAGWLVVMGLPTALLLVLALFAGSSMKLSVDGEHTSLMMMHDLPVPLQTMGWAFAVMSTTLVLATLSVLAQLPGLARRDVQDRSIEFWRSLPSGDAQSVGATVLMHLLVLPGAAVVAGVLGAQIVALVGIVSHQGAMAWLQQPWWMLLPALAVVTLRALLGLLLAVAWLSPLLLLTMAASAWLKRWALPAVAAVLIAGVQWVDHQLPMAVFKPSLERLGSEALNALMATHALRGRHFEGPEDVAAALPDLVPMLLRDGAEVLFHAASPAFALALLGAAVGFGLMVLRRRQQG